MCLRGRCPFVSSISLTVFRTIPADFFIYFPCSFVSRVAHDNNERHSILGVHSISTKLMAEHLQLNINNGWGELLVFCCRAERSRRCPKQLFVAYSFFFSALSLPYLPFLPLFPSLGIVISLVNFISKQEDGTFLILKDPKSSSLQIFSVPDDFSQTSEEHEAAADDQRDEPGILADVLAAI